MSHVIWKGAISFGLVHIPVRLYSAEKRNSFDLTMVDRRSMKPVGFKRYNKESGEEVPQDQIVKGYEYERGRFVILTDKDFRDANIEATQTIDIIRFIKGEEISPTYFDTPYYLMPEKRGEKGYFLLRDVLAHTHKIGIATVVIYTRQYVAAVIPLGKIIVMNTLRYANELRDVHELEWPSKQKAVEVTAKEKEMAIKLVKEMTGAWDPRDYHDTYHEDLLKLIDERVRSGETKVITPNEPEETTGEPRRGKVVDLMALLKRSLRDPRQSKPSLRARRKLG